MYFRFPRVPPEGLSTFRVGQRFSVSVKVCRHSSVYIKSTIFLKHFSILSEPVPFFYGGGVPSKSDLMGCLVQMCSRSRAYRLPFVRPLSVLLFRVTYGYYLFDWYLICGLGLRFSVDTLETSM